jgi:type I restriction enzyme R subunit
MTKSILYARVSSKEQEQEGFSIPSQENLPILLTNIYQSLEDAKAFLGDVKSISSLFVEFQKYLYAEVA